MVAIEKETSLTKEKRRHNSVELKSQKSKKKTESIRNFKFNFAGLLPKSLRHMTTQNKRDSKTSISPNKQIKRHIVQVEDVTEEMLSNIALVTRDKIHSPEGTTCHHCRQKTLDQKTCCRSENCLGIQGQICGVCITNKYSESITEALLTPNWTCFKCRGICQCSRCRNAKAVKYQSPNSKPTRVHIKELIDKLLGFSPKDEIALLANSKISRIIYCSSCNFNNRYIDTDNLLGFKDSDTALMVGGNFYNLGI